LISNGGGKLNLKGYQVYQLSSSEMDENFILAAQSNGIFLYYLNNSLSELQFKSNFSNGYVWRGVSFNPYYSEYFLGTYSYFLCLMKLNYSSFQISNI
jgi:hypothetical protein